MDRRWLWLLIVPIGLTFAYGWYLSDWFRPDIPTAPPGGNVTLEPFADGFDRPVFLFEHQGVPLVVEQAGRLVHLNGTPYLDIRDRVASDGERGLLGAASDGRLFVHYTDKAGDTVLARFDGPDETILLQVKQPYPNHNGGMIAFGPDGYLYMGLGDGGLAGDPLEHAQNPDTLLGSILRLDVSTTIGAPPDNPFVDGGGHEYVWAYGLRNPWRFSFDGGDLWVGDVGQGAVEEISRIRPDETGANLGWPLFEGTTRYRIGTVSDHHRPITQYDHDGGHCSVTGGYVLPSGYVFGDYCSGQIWLFDGTLKRALDTDLNISSFAKLGSAYYVIDHGGSIWHIASAGSK